MILKIIKKIEKKWLLQEVFTKKSKLPKVLSKDMVTRKELLKKTQELLKKNKIELFVVLGTCLGTVREQGFIQHDHDIDIAFYEDDTKKIKPLLNKLEKCGLYLEEITPANLRFQAPQTNCTLDFWIIHRVRNPIQRLLGYKWLINNGLFKTDYFNPNIVQKGYLEGIEVRLPSHTEAYLIEHYGQTWKTPQKGMNAIYRGLISQLLNTLFFTSKMPAKFSGVNERLVYKTWISKLLKLIAPKAKITNKYKHPN